MEHTKDWTDTLRQRLEHHQAPVPDDLWDSIAHELDKQNAIEHKPRFISLRKWALVAASILALVMGSTVYLYTHQEEAMSFAQSQVRANNNPGIEKMNDENNREIYLSLLARNEKMKVKTESQNDLSQNNIISDSSNYTFTEVEQGTNQLPKQQKEKTVTNVGQTEERTLNAEHHREYASSSKRDVHSQHVRNTQKKRNLRLSLDLLTSGTFSQDNQTNSPMVVSQSMIFNDMLASPSANDVNVGASYDKKKHHNQPISLGISVNFALNNHISLSSGLTYTKATSDFTSSYGGFQKSETQTLRYLGIPLKINYVIWKTRLFKTYATIGGQADINMSASVDSDEGVIDIDKDRTQFSFNASVGAEYDIIPQVGFYVEPGIKYYFDNGSHVENIFKENPCRFDLQLGLRINLGNNKN